MPEWENDDLEQPLTWARWRRIAACPQARDLPLWQRTVGTLVLLLVGFVAGWCHTKPEEITRPINEAMIAWDELEWRQEKRRDDLAFQAWLDANEEQRQAFEAWKAAEVARGRSWGRS